MKTLLQGLLDIFSPLTLNSIADSVRSLCEWQNIESVIFDKRGIFTAVWVNQIGTPEQRKLYSRLDFSIKLRADFDRIGKVLVHPEQAEFIMDPEDYGIPGSCLSHFWMLRTWAVGNPADPLV